MITSAVSSSPTRRRVRATAGAAQACPPARAMPCRALGGNRVSRPVGSRARAAPRTAWCVGPRRRHDACGRRRIHSSFPHHRAGRGPRRPPPAHCGHALARARDRRRRLAGRAAREAPGARALLGHGLRLAQGRSEAQRLAAVRHDDRRRGHSLHPRALASSERLAADHDPRLARVDLRAAEDRRAAHRSDGLRRTCGGRVRSRHSFDSRLRLLRQADAAPAGIPTASREPGQS